MKITMILEKRRAPSESVFRRGLGREASSPRLGGQHTAELRRAQHLAELRREVVRPAARDADRSRDTESGHGSLTAEGHPEGTFVAVAGLRVVVEVHRELHDHREEETVLLLRELDVRVVALHRELEEAADLVLVLSRLHAVEPRDRNPEHELVVELGVGDLHVALVVAAVANLLDVPFNRNFSRCHGCNPPVNVLGYHDTLVAGVPDSQGFYHDSDAVKNSILWPLCQAQQKISISAALHLNLYEFND